MEEKIDVTKEIDDRGLVKHPMLWNQDWMLKEGTIEHWINIAEKQLPKLGNENEIHRQLKICCILHAFQNFVDEDYQFEFENRTEEGRCSLRPDISLYSKQNDLSVAYECGSLTYKDKIEDLLKDRYDVVIWVINGFDYNLLRKLFDSTFFSKILCGRTADKFKDDKNFNRKEDECYPFRMTSERVYLGKNGDKHWELRYCDVNKIVFENDSDSIKYMMFFRKSKFKKKKLGRKIG